MPPMKSSDIESSSYLRLLVMGAPKCGKTRTVIATAPGGVYVINSDDKYSLKPAANVCSFEHNLALGNDAQKIEECLKEARLGVKEGRYKTIVWDTLTEYARRMEDVFADATRNGAGEPDGRRYWLLHRKHIINIVDRLFELKAHVIANVHYMEMPGAIIEGQMKKSGEGIVPSLAGELRTKIPAMFQDVVFLEKRQGIRTFITSTGGVFGPGGRSLPGVSSCDANITTLWELMNSGGPTKKKKVVSP